MTANTWIGPYQILREVGRGGAGVVYEVVAQEGDRRLALKLLHANQSTPEALLRFGREAQLLAQVRHPSVVRILDLKRTETGDPYIVTDLIPGEELAKQARAKPPPWEQSAKIVRELADALAVLHSKGILHRDLKPQNVIMHVEGHPVLLDFGLARDGESAEERLTQTGVFMGTPAYAAPEQVEDASQVGPQADVYGLGAILYFLLSGHAPYSGTSIRILTKLVQGTPPSWPSVDDASVPLELEAVCKRAMRTDLSERTPSAEALRDELDAYLRGEGEAEGDPSSRATLAFGVLAVILMLGALALGWWGLRTGPADDPVGETGAELDPDPSDLTPAPLTVVRGEPTAEQAAGAELFRTLAEARAAQTGGPRKMLDLLYAVHYRNARAPLWKEAHRAPLRDPEEGGRLMPPRAVFTPQADRLITFGGRLPGDPKEFTPAPPQVWLPSGSHVQPLDPPLVRWTFNAVMRLPNDDDSVVLIESVRRHTTFHSVNNAQGFDASEERLGAYASSIDAIEGWEGGADKPVSVSLARPDGKEFALGTRQSGPHLPKKNVVLRVPFPLLKGNAPDFTPPESRCKEIPITSGPVRALAYGPPPSNDLWILGSNELYRWSGDALHRESTASSRWWTLVVADDGRAFVGGNSGLTWFGPDGEEFGQFPLAEFSSLDGLALFDERYALAVGTAHSGRGVWATLDLATGSFAPRVVQSGESDFAYASISLSEKARRACFMRWDGEFEVWDLDAMLPWTEEQTAEGSSDLAPEADEPDEQFVIDEASVFKGRVLARARVSLEKDAKYRNQILDRVALNNSQQPVWKGVHAELQPSEDDLPRSCFLARSRFMTFGGRVSDTLLAPPRSWDPKTKTSMARMDSQIQTEVRACIPDPRSPKDAVLLKYLQDRSPLRIESDGSLAQELDGLRSMRDSWTQEIRDLLDKKQKPLSVVTFTPEHRELLLGTTASGSPPGTYVLRLPLEEELPEGWFTVPSKALAKDPLLRRRSVRDAFREDAATLSPALPLQGAVRAMATLGEDQEVWVLGERALLRWSGTAVEEIATPEEGERWFDLVALEVGSRYVVVGGSKGLRLFTDQGHNVPLAGVPLDEVRGLLEVPDFGPIPRPLEKPALVQRNFFVYGVRDGQAAWAVIAIDGLGVSVFASSPTAKTHDPSPYVSLSTTESRGLACLMRGSGRFELWDLESIRYQVFRKRR